MAGGKHPPTPQHGDSLETREGPAKVRTSRQTTGHGSTSVRAITGRVAGGIGNYRHSNEAGRETFLDGHRLQQVLAPALREVCQVPDLHIPLFPRAGLVSRGALPPPSWVDTLLPIPISSPPRAPDTPGTTATRPPTSLTSRGNLHLLAQRHRYPKWHHGFWASCPNMAQIFANI